MPPGIPYLRERIILQRLFSTFANGWPGKGLMILRLALSAFLLHSSFALFMIATNWSESVLLIMTSGLGALVLIGLFTPIAGALGAIFELWMAFSRPGEPWTYGLASAMAASLALLGPGAWSIDARVYGRKRISLQDW